MRANLILAVILGVVGSCSRPDAPGVTELWIGGDVHLGASTHDPLSGITHLIAGATGIVNLEGPVGEGAETSTERRLVNSPSTLGVLPRHRVAVVGVANNHTFDLGAPGAIDTLDQLSRRGIHAANGTAARIDISGRRVAVTAHDLASGVPRRLGDDLAAARRNTDHLVAMFHVTGPPSFLPRPELREAVELAVAAGAQVIAAHGSHVVGPVERRGDVVIAWGLGNLAFACPCTSERDGLLLRVSLGHNSTTAKVIPIEAGLGQRSAGPSRERALMLELLAKLGSTTISRQGDI